MLKLTSALFAVCLNCGLYGACTSPPQTPPSVAPPPAVQMSSQEACKALTADLEKSVPEFAKRLTIDMGGPTTIEIQKIQCAGDSLIAELFVRCIIGDTFVEAVFTVGMTIDSSGKVNMDVLDSSKVGSGKIQKAGK